MGDIKESSVLLKTFGEGMKDVDTEGGGGGRGVAGYVNVRFFILSDSRK